MTPKSDEQNLTPCGVVSLCYSGHPKESTIPNLYPYSCRYTRSGLLIDEKVVEQLYAISHLPGVFRIEELRDESWELVVQESYCLVILDIISKTFASSKIELNHDSLQSRPEGMERWHSVETGRLRQFFPLCALCLSIVSKYYSISNSISVFN